MRIILSILLLSFIYPRRDCLKQTETDALGRSTRPDKHTYAVSDLGYFYIWYDTTGSAVPDFQDSNPENGVPDYVDEVGAIADSAYHVLVNIMEFSAPPADADGFYDIYLENYADGSYGYNRQDSPSQNQSGSTSYMQIDNDYDGFNSTFNLTPLQIMRISVAHEYFHGIQWGYVENLGNNAYFYEMTSMWFEDVLIHDGNDYLDGFVDPLLDNPTAEFDNTGGGYELALFGHYLTSFIDLNGQLDAKQSTIMREIWERYSNCADYPVDHSNYHTTSECNSRGAFYAVEDILKDNYNTTFIESWVDFISRNLYNGIYENMDNDFYYYIDQALIEPISTSPSPLTDFETFSIEIDLDNESAAIKSYQLGKSGLLGIENLSAEYLGRFSIVSTSNNNDLFWAEDTSGIELTSNSDIHFVYGSETEGSVPIDIMYTPEINPYIYSLEDINPNSTTYGQTLSPGYFANQITAHYFGHQN